MATARETVEKSIAMAKEHNKNVAVINDKVFNRFVHYLYSKGKLSAGKVKKIYIHGLKYKGIEIRSTDLFLPDTFKRKRYSGSSKSKPSVALAIHRSLYIQNKQNTVKGYIK